MTELALTSEELAERATRFDFGTVYVIGRQPFRLTVEKRSAGKWAVCDGILVRLRSGEWDYEPSPSGRGDEWLASSRWTRDEAIAEALRIKAASIGDDAWQQWLISVETP